MRTLHPVTMALALLLAAAALAGCKKSEPAAPAAGCAKDTDCKGDRVCAKGECVEPAATAAPTAGPIPTAAGPIPTAAVAPVGTGGPAAGGAVAQPGGGAAAPAGACEAAVAAFRTLASKTATTEQLAKLPSVEQDVQACKDQAWPAALLACLPQVGSMDEYFSQCAKLAFGGTLDMHVQRELAPGTEPTADGDYVLYHQGGDGKCGLLYKTVAPVSAMFVLCGNEVLAGPLTTVAEVTGVVREIAAGSRAGHDLRQRIVQNWPSGGGTHYRIYDGNGRYLRDQ